MFTGIIEEEGKITKIISAQTERRIWVSTSISAVRGDSVAVDGVCLTVEKADNGELLFFLSDETLNVTKFKNHLRVGQWVNLEHAMRPDSFMGGHIVQGHVDATGRITGIKKDRLSRTINIKFPPAYNKYIIVKGSIAVDGISLTVNSIHVSSFQVKVIPHTLSVTNLKRRKTGDIVNLEFDIIGKYIDRIMSQRA